VFEGVIGKHLRRDNRGLRRLNLNQLVSLLRVGARLQES